MQRMWSPWRSRHIDRITADGNYSESDVFVQIGRHPERDDENLVIWRGRTLYVVLNLFPYNNGHLLIVPYRAVTGYEDLVRKEQVELAETIGRCTRWLTAALRPDGFNIGMNIGRAAGAGIPHHLHAHVIPRWSGDTNFMPVVADTKVIPESMRDTFGKLKAAVEGTLAEAGEEGEKGSD